MPSARCQGRKEGGDAEQRRELLIEAPAHDEEERAQHEDGGERAGRALGGALDHEGSPHEGVGRAHQLEDLDLGFAAMEEEAAWSSR